MNRIARVDVRKKQVRAEDVPGPYERLGGRALTSRIVHDEVGPGCDPLGRHNKLILAAGLLAGTPVTSSGRISVGAKSLLTGGIKEANAGGTFAHALANMGFRAIVLEDRPETNGSSVLIVRDQAIVFEDARDLQGLGTYQTGELLRERYGRGIAFVCTGPAGEMRLAGAALAVSDPEGRPTRQAARGGLGAILAAKGLKAIVVDRTRSFGEHNAALLEVARDFAKRLIDDPKTGKNMPTYGTSGIVAAVNAIGALPTRNFRTGRYEQVEAITGESLRQTIQARGGEGRSGLACMNGCVIRCSNVYPDESGKALVSTLQYETIALLGSNLGIGSLDEIARLNWLCNDIGLDTIEAGAAIGVAMEAGLEEFGDASGATRLLEAVRAGTALGRAVGSGAWLVGRLYGVSRVPHCKGQGLPGYDPRALKGNGVTYSTSTMGADHTAGNAFGSRDKVDQLKPDGQVELSIGLQTQIVMFDMTGLCMFARPPILADSQLLPRLLNARFGWGIGGDDLQAMCKEVLSGEYAFNEQAGIGETHDVLPEFFQEEALPPHNVVYDVPREEIRAGVARLKRP